MRAQDSPLKTRKSVALGPALPCPIARSQEPQGVARTTWLLRGGLVWSERKLCSFAPRPASPDARSTARLEQAGHVSSLLQLARFSIPDSFAALGPAQPATMAKSAGSSWEAMRKPRRRSAEAGSLSAKGAVLVCNQLLFLNNNLMEETIRQGRFFDEVNPMYHAKIGRMLGYIHQKCLFLSYEGHPSDKVDVGALPLYPKGRPGPAKPADVINHIIDLVNINPKTLQKALSVTPIMNMRDEVGQLIRYASGKLPRQPWTHSPA